MRKGDRVGRFTIDELVGTGTFASVWLATDPDLQLPVALKVLADNWSQDLEVRRRFVEEARILRRADSDRVVRVHELGELPDGRPWFAMAWADGGSLRDRIERHGPIDPAAAAALGQEIALAADVLHRTGVLHRDIKPENILYQRRADSSERLVLADLGLARDLASSRLTLVAGSPAYMAPEQAAGRNDIGAPADVWAVGAVVLEAATGRIPGQGVDEALRGLRSVDPGGAGLAAVLEAALAPEPSARPQSAADLAARFSAVAEQPNRDAGPPNRTPRRATIIAAVAAVMALGIAAWSLLRADDGPEHDTTAVASTDATEPTSDLTGNAAEDEPTPASTPPLSVPPVTADPTEAADSRFPLPAGFVRSKESEGDTTVIVAFTSATVEEVGAFYDGLVDWTVDEHLTDGGEHVWRLSAADGFAEVRAAPGAETAADDILELVVTLSQR